MGRLAKLHEDRYASAYDEVDDLLNGGWDAFEADDDLLNPEKADAIHRNAQAAGMSDLDYVNREEALESIEDDWAYELETQDYYSDMSNVVNSRSIKDIYDEEAAEMADAGFISGGYGSRISDGPSLLNNIIEGAVQYIGDEIPTPDYSYKAFGPKVIQTWLEESAKYVGNPVTPKCEAFHEALVVLAQEYNDILQNVLGNPEWPEPIVVPAANGKVNESEELKPLTKKFMETLPTNIDSYKKFKAACKKAGYKASEADYGDYNQYYLKESSMAKKAKKLKEALEVYTFDDNQPKGEVIDLCAPILGDLSTREAEIAAERQIDDALRAEEVWCEYVECIHPETQGFCVSINGDWKHDHLLADHIMWEKFHLTCIGTDVTEDNGSDCYGAIHQYVHTGLNNKYQEANKLPVARVAESKKVRKSRIDEEFDSIEKLAAFADKTAKDVIDNVIFDNQAIEMIKQNLNCDDDYACGCLDSWIELENIRRNNVMTEGVKKLHEGPKTERWCLRDVLIEFNGMVDEDQVSEYCTSLKDMCIRVGAEDGFRLSRPSAGQVRCHIMDEAMAEDVLHYASECAEDLGMDLPVRICFRA